MGGSQLTGLKASLHSTGLSRSSKPKASSKKKATPASSNLTRADRQQALDNVVGGYNLFDTRDVKKKWDVVERGAAKKKEKRQNVSQARSRGLEARKKALLPLLDARNHASTFIDHRFASNAHLTQDERDLARFTQERTSQLASTSAAAGPSRKRRFNIEDDDEEFTLTHGGRKLGFGDEQELEDGGLGSGWGGLGEGQAGTSANREMLLGSQSRSWGPTAEGADGEPDRKRSRAEIMEEVMNKSKAFKATRQKLKTEDDEKRLELDREWKEMRGIFGRDLPVHHEQLAGKAAVADAESESDEEDEEPEDGSGAESESDDEVDDEEEEPIGEEELEQALNAAGKSGVDRELLRKLIGSPSDSESGSEMDNDDDAEDEEEEAAERPTHTGITLVSGDRAERIKKSQGKEADPYDSYVRLLSLSKRAAPADRLPSALELAEKEKKELERLEKERRARMRGEEPAGAAAGKGKRKPEGDDLGDDWEGESGDEEEEEDDLVGRGLEVESDMEEEDLEEEDDEDSDDEEDENVDLESDDDEEHEQVDEDLVATSAAGKKRSQASKSEQKKKKALPYTFPCPSTHVEFLDLLSSSGIDDWDVVEVVRRVRVLYHPGLGEGNKERLAGFGNVLFDHVIYLAGSPPPPPASSNVAEDGAAPAEERTTFSAINSLLPHLLTLTHAFPSSAASHHLLKLSLMSRNLTTGLSRGAELATSRTWPGLAELTLLRIVGLVWSTSDKSHPVAAPALLLIAQYLEQARLRGVKDLAAGLFLCSLVAQYENYSKRLVPEVVNFLVAAVGLVMPLEQEGEAALGREARVPSGMREKVEGLEKLTEKQLKKASVPAGGAVDLTTVLRSEEDDEQGGSKQVKIQLMGVAVKLLMSFIGLWRESGAFIEVFEPVLNVLEAVKSGALKVQFDPLVVELKRSLSLAKDTRKPLELQKHRAIAIPTFNPKFEEKTSSAKGRFDPDSERVEAQKLKKMYKKEKKGAIKELRKDGRFLAVEEGKRKAEKDAAYSRKIQGIMAGLQNERAEEKAYDKAREGAKKRDKARSGRK